jgi:fatty-acyl-CoA synthase
VREGFRLLGDGFFLYSRGYAAFATDFGPCDEQCLRKWPPSSGRFRASLGIQTGQMRAIDYFDKAADLYPDRTAIIDGGRRFSFRETRDISDRIARAMRALMLADDERAAIYSPNDARVLFCMLGILRAGAVWIPVNSRNAAEAIIAYMNYVETSWLFYHATFREAVEEIQARVPTLCHLISLDEWVGAPGDDDGKKALKSPQRNSTPHHNQSLEDFMELGAGMEEVDWGDPYGNIEQLVGLVPTGGTTGPAKGVRVTNLAWGTMTEMASHYWRSADVEPVCLDTAPLSHAAGVVAFATLAIGATNVIMPRFDALEVLGNIQKFKVTHLFLPPTAFYNLLAHPEVNDFDYSSLRVFLLAGSPVSADKLKRGVEVFGPCMCQCYGQTESPMLLTWLDQRTVAAAADGDHPERLASCGRPTSAVRLAIMDDAGHILGPNEPGEIVARGSLVTSGYYKLPEATGEIRGHGWHHTGDVGYIDNDGFVYIVDRKKDMIISGGFNVFCAEVEAAIMSLPEVYECAVIGVPDDKWGEAVKALVVLEETRSMTEQEIISHCKARLGGVKAPKSVEFRQEILKTPAGKIDRKAMRKPYWLSTDRGVH